MRILVDTNIVLDFLLDREPFVYQSALLFQKIASEQMIGYATATTLTDIFYVSRRHTRSIERARQAVAITLVALEICPVDKFVLEAALSSTTADFEDALQIACALAHNLDAIVTRDMELTSGLISVLSVEQALQHMNV